MYQLLFGIIKKIKWFCPNNPGSTAFDVLLLLFSLVVFTFPSFSFDHFLKRKKNVEFFFRRLKLGSLGWPQVKSIDHWKIRRACLYQASPQNVLFLKERKKNFPKTCLVLLAGKFEGALSGDKYEVFYRTVYIDSVLVGLVGTASTSDFPVVYG